MAILKKFMRPSRQRVSSKGLFYIFQEIILQSGEVHFVELKAEGGRLSDAQAAVKHHLIAAGHGYHCSSDYADVVETLTGWRVLRSGIHVQTR
jgi:hypothetical protein